MSKLTLTPCVFFFFLKLHFFFEIALISERIFFLLLLFSKGRASPGLFFYRGAFVSNSFGQPGQIDQVELFYWRPDKSYDRHLPNLANAWQAFPLLCRSRSSRQGGRDSRQGGRDSRQGGRDVANEDNGDNGEEMNIKMLRMSVPGEPGVVRNPIII